MIITVGPNKTIFISEFRKKVICDLINRFEFDEVIFAEICASIDRIYNASLNNLNNSWQNKIEKGEITSELFAEVILSHPDYLDRLEREKTAEMQRCAQFEIK